MLGKSGFPILKSRFWSLDSAAPLKYGLYGWAGDRLALGCAQYGTGTGTADAPSSLHGIQQGPNIHRSQHGALICVYITRASTM